MLWLQIWSLVGGVCCIVLPIYESWDSLTHIALGLWAMVRGKPITQQAP